MGHYTVGQVCLNGHAITSGYDESPELRSDFCPQCGESTIHQCQHCQTNIRGTYEVSGVLTLGHTWEPSKFCHACGKPYPWTERAVEAAKELADEIEGIGPDELEKAKKSFIDLAADTPQTTLAATRVKKLIAKAGPVVGNGIREIVTSIATEAAKKSMGL